MKRIRTTAILALFLAATSLLRAEGNITEQQKQIPDNKGVLVIELPGQKRNVNVAPDSIIPENKNNPDLRSTDQNIILKTRSRDNNPTFPPKPTLNVSGRYYVPAENSPEWVYERLKAETEGIKWENCLDDLTLNRPGDSWDGMSKVFNFQFATTISALSFLTFYNKDGLKMEDRGKAFLLTAVVMTIVELANSSGPKNHFCSKNLASSLAGAACGSFLITAGIGF